jgi:adenylate cyclase class 2
MAEGGLETEVKFFVLRLPILQGRIAAVGGRLLTPRTHERNLRFDTPDGSLRRAGEVLRLRRDSENHLTFKGPSEFKDGARSRTELEIIVGDFDDAQRILEALGYVVVFEYEKYRTTFQLGEVQVMLDELPTGDFVEIEGRHGLLQPAAELIGLDWSTAITESYHALFERLQLATGLTFRDLTFSNFEGGAKQGIAMGVQPADR